MTELCVNVDHVATLRQARGVAYPDPVQAARLAERAGAHGITIHLRSDRRHIQDSDLARLRDVVRGKLNLEIATTEEMIAIALRHRPDQVSLVPERPDEVTTEGGLDVVARPDRVRITADRLAAAGIRVSVFLDPDPRQLEALFALDRSAIAGFEINTDLYSRGVPGQIETLRDVARRGHEAGFAVYAGHGLTVGNVSPVAAIPEIEELNIGHAIVSRAVLIGMAAAVEEMLAAMAATSEVS